MAVRQAARHADAPRGRRGGLFPSLAAARKAVQRRELEPAGKDGPAHLYYIAELAKTLRSVIMTRQ